MAEPTNKITQDPAMECARSSSSIDANQEDPLLSSNDMGHTLSFKDIEPVYDKLVFVYKFCIQAERLERLANILDIRLKTELKRIYGCCYILVAATKTRDDQFLSLKKGLDILNITEEDIKNASQLTSLPRDNLIEVVNELYTQVMKHSETDTMLALAEAKRELKKASDSKTLIKCLSLQLDYARILRELTKDTIKSCAELNALTLKSLRLLSPGKRIDAPTSSLIQQAVALDVLQYSAMLNGEQAHHYLSQINRLFVLEDLDRQLVKQLLKAFITPRKPLINASEYYVTASRFMHSAKALQGWSADDIAEFHLIEDKINMRKASADLLINLEVLSKQLNPAPKNLNLILLNNTMTLFIEHTKLMHLFSPDEKVIRQFSGMIKKALPFVDSNVLAVLDEQIKNAIRLLDEQQKGHLSTLREQVKTLITPLSTLISTLRTSQDTPFKVEASSSRTREVATHRKTKRGSSYGVDNTRKMSPRHTHISTSSSAASSQQQEKQLTSECQKYLIFSAAQEWMTPEINDIILDIYTFCISSERLQQLSSISDTAKRKVLQDIYLNCYKIIALGGHNHVVYPLFKKALAVLQTEAVDSLQLDEFAAMPHEHLISLIHETHGWIQDCQKADTIAKIKDAERQRALNHLHQAPDACLEALETNIIAKITDAATKYNDMPNEETVIACLEAQLEYSQLLFIQSKETAEGFAALDELISNSMRSLPPRKMDKRSSALIQAALEFNIERYSFHLSQGEAMAHLARKNLHACLLQLNQLFSLTNPKNKLVMKLLGIFIIFMSPSENESHYFDALNKFYSRAIKLPGWKKQDLEQLDIYQKMLRFNTLSVALKDHLDSLLSQPDLPTPNHDLHLLNDMIKLFINYLGLIHFVSPLEIIMERFIEAIDKFSATVEADVLITLSKAIKKAVLLLEKMQRQEFSTQREATLMMLKPLSLRVAELQSQTNTALQKASAPLPKPKAPTSSKATRTTQSKHSKPKQQGNKRKSPRSAPVTSSKNNGNTSGATPKKQSKDAHDLQQSVVLLTSEINVISPVLPSTHISDMPDQPIILLESGTTTTESIPLFADLSDIPEQPVALLEPETGITESASSLTELSDTPEQLVTHLEPETSTAKSASSFTAPSDAPEQPVPLCEPETNTAEPALSSIHQVDTTEPSVQLEEQQHEEEIISSSLPEPSNQPPTKNSLAVMRHGFFFADPIQMFMHELNKKAGVLNTQCTKLFALREQYHFLFHSFNCMKTSLFLMTQYPIVPELIEITSQNLRSLDESLFRLSSEEKDILASYIHLYGECSNWIGEQTKNLLDFPPMTYGAEFLIDADRISLCNRAFVLGQYLNNPHTEVHREELSLLLRIENDHTLLSKDPSLLFFVLRMQAHYSITPAEPLADFLKNESRNFLMDVISYNAHTVSAIMDTVWAGFANGNALAFYQQLRVCNVFDLLFPNAAECLKNNLTDVFEKTLEQTNNLSPEERDRIYIFNQLFLTTPAYHGEKNEYSAYQLTLY